MPDPVDAGQVRRTGRWLDAALWAVAVLVGAYSLVNVHGMATGHGTEDPQAWLLAPIVDIALFAGITADSVLSRYGVAPTRWGVGLRWFCGAATWALNVWDAAAGLDPGAIVAHSVPPVVLILLAEAAPRYRQQFAAVADAVPVGVSQVATGDADASDAVTAGRSRAVPGQAAEAPCLVPADASHTAEGDVSPDPPGGDSASFPPAGPEIPGARPGRVVIAELLAATPDAATRTVSDLAADLGPRAGLAVTTARRYISATRNGGGHA